MKTQCSQSWLSKWTQVAMLACAALVAVTAAAQTFPGKLITVIHPYNPGSLGEISIRKVMDRVSVKLGQPYIIEFRTGGNEVVAMQALLRAPADGHTIAFTSQVMPLNPYFQKLPYDTKDFQPLMRYAQYGNVIGVRPDLPVKNFQEFVEYVKKNPGKLNLAYAGNYLRLSQITLAQRANLDWTQIAYTSETPALQALLGGHIDAYYFSTMGAINNAKTGKLKVLAVMGPERMKEFPDVPTLNELYPGYESTIWFGFVAKAGTPRAAVDRWNAELQTVLKDPEIQKWFTENGVQPLYGTPEDMEAYIKRQSDEFATAAKILGIKPE